MRLLNKWPRTDYVGNSNDNISLGAVFATRRIYYVLGIER
jgi:hypothetical protein